MFRNISVILSANSTSFTTQMRAAGTALDDFARKGDTTAARSESAVGRLSKVWLALGVTMAAALLGAISAAASFETQMRNVNSISGLSETQFASLSKSVLNLSTTLPQSATDLAKGLYDIASSGFQGAEGLQVLEASAKAASAGLATTAEAAKAVTAVLNAYGLGAEEAQRVSDILFQTVNLGVVTFSELTGVIGDVVGSAAAAGVSIEQVGAAVATMTLSGVSAAEAGTSLNRVLQSFIKPSESMQMALNALGYESGVAALKQDGLRGVMEKLRIATGGNVEVTVALFDEIRAARGALALMSDEGRNYERVVNGMADATTGVGATQRAFNEQMKSLSAQVKIARNEIMAFAIQGATPLLGFLRDAIAGMRSLAEAAGPGLGRAIQALGPFFSNMAAVGGDLVRIIQAMSAALGPLAGALVGLGGGVTIATLNALAAALSAVTGFLAENEQIVAGLAIMYGVRLVGGLAGAIAQMAVWRASAIASTVASTGLGLAIQQQVQYFGVLGLAIRAIPFVALAALIGGIVGELQKSGQAAKQLGEDLRAGLDLNSSAGLRELASRANEAAESVQKAHRSFGPFSGAVRELEDIKTDKKLKAVAEAALEASVSQRHLAANTKIVSEATGQTGVSVEALAKKLGIDLTLAGDAAKAGNDRLIRTFTDLAKEAFGSSEAISAAGLDLKELEERAKATQESLKKVAESFAKDTDAISGYAKFLADATKDSEAYTAAQEKLSKSQKELNDLRARQSEKDHLTIADQQALANAQDKVAAAQRGVAAASKEIAGTSLAAFYEENLSKAQAFADNIQKLATAGLDPNVIMRLMQAGPEAAAPFIQGILEGNTAALIRIVNEGEQALATINTKVLANARLTQQALNDSKSDQKIRDIGLAMQVSAASIDAAGNITKQAIADKIDAPLADVIRVVDAFGITVAGVPTKIAPAANASDRWKESLLNLRANLQANGPFVDEYTEAGKRNKAALDQVIEAVKEHIKELVLQGATMDEKRAAFNRHIEDLRATLSQAGLTKAEIDALVLSLRTVEGRYMAEVDVDTGAAMDKLARLRAELASIDASIVQSGPGGGRGAAANQLREDVAAVESGGEPRYEEPPLSRPTGDLGDSAQGNILGRYGIIPLAGGGRTKGFRTRGPAFLVGEGDPNYEEYVIATDPIHGDRNRKLWMMAGRKLKMLASGGLIAYGRDPGDVGGVVRDANGNVVGYSDSSFGGADYVGPANLTPYGQQPGDVGGAVRDASGRIIGVSDPSFGARPSPVSMAPSSATSVRNASSHRASSFLSGSIGSGWKIDLGPMIQAIIDDVLARVSIYVPVEVDGREIARVASEGMHDRRRVRS